MGVMVCRRLGRSGGWVGKFEWFIDMGGVGGGVGGGRKGVYVYEVEGIGGGFILKDGEEDRKGGMEKRVWEMMVGVDRVEVEMVDGDCRELGVVGKCMGYVVKVMVGGVGYMVVEGWNV